MKNAGKYIYTAISHYCFFLPLVKSSKNHENGFTPEIFLQFLVRLNLYRTRDQKNISVAIRFSKLKNNMSMLHLEVSTKGEKTTLKSLKLSIYDKPINRIQKDHNKLAWEKAESIKAVRLSELQLGIGAFTKSNQCFIKYFKTLVDERRYSGGNYGNWKSAYKHLIDFCNSKSVRLIDVNEHFLNKFKKFLLEGNLSRGGKNLAQNSASSYFLKVKAALNEAVNQRLIHDNPVKRVKGISTEEKPRNYLLVEELEILKNTDCKYPILKKAFLFSCLTGLRWSDIEKLTWKEIKYSDAEERWKFILDRKN